MTDRPLPTVVSGLLARGIPAQWATEQEAAALSGMCVRVFRARRADLEAHGFPKADPANGKRFIPAIMDFWRARAQPAVAGAPMGGADERAREKWDGR